MSNESDDSAELLYRFQRGDGAAFEALYARHGAPLRNLVWTILERADDSRLDELTQRIWTKVIDAPPGERIQNFRAWLAAVARNTCHDEFRARKRDRGTPVAEERADESPSHDHLAGVRADVRAAMDSLPADEREVLELRHGEGLAFSEIAARSGEALTTIQNRFYRAMNRLRPRLQAWAPFGRKARET